MKIGPGEINAPRINFLSVARLNRRQIPTAVENFGHDTVAVVGKMNDGKDGRGEVGGELAHERGEGFDSTRRCANDNHVMCGHLIYSFL